MQVKDDTYGQAALQEKMLEILQYLIHICEKHHLTYFLAGGTCLGAIRHQGFIPWDDDLDVLMPRDDYERLWQLADSIAKDSHYVLCRTTEDRNYHHRVMQLADTNTTFIHNRCVDEDIEHGVYIDIVPLDYQATSLAGRLEQTIDAIIFSIFNIQCAPEYNGGRLTPLISAVSNALLKAVPQNERRFRIWEAAEKRMTSHNRKAAKNFVVITSTVKELFKPFPLEWFDVREAPFEDISAIIPKQAEDYCTKMYGDYMALPPEDSRTPRHNTAFIDLQTPYTHYKGVYYCVGQRMDTE